MEEPQLAPPGAGLPPLELFFARYLMFPTSFAIVGVQGSIRNFEKETESILSLVKPLSAEVRNKKVLIKRLRGLEDSSRFWSVNMVLEHLCITMKGMSTVADLLAKGTPVTREISTALVKPKNGDERDEMLERFQKGFDEAVKLIKSASDSKSQLTCAHPWFGPMTATQWIWVLGVHQRLHRTQIEKILAGSTQP